MKTKEITKTVIYLNKHERKVVREYNDIYSKILDETNENRSVIDHILSLECFENEEDFVEGD